MPSPVGHALAGLSVAWASDLISGGPARPAASRTARWLDHAGGWLPVTAALLGAAPDLDLFVGVHRTATHSLTAALLVGIAAAAVARQKNLPAARIGIVCALAWGSHLLLDWLGVDTMTPRGIQLLWPFSRSFFISGWDLFAGTQRIQMLTSRAMRQNAMAISREVAVFTPILFALWLAARGESLASHRDE
jgi:membrane-bound metal-dependent hydrolase YbcI (DUF457 family)